MFKGCNILFYSHLHLNNILKRNKTETTLRGVSAVGQGR